MGFSSPLQDVKGYSSSKPPIVVFVMCLLLFACATFAMAFYIQYTDIISNPEIKSTWKKFLFDLGSFRLCTYVEDGSSEADIVALSQSIDGDTFNSSSERKTASITVAASVFLLRQFTKFPSGMMAVTGRINVYDVFEHVPSPSSLNMTFLIPENLTETTFKDTCVIITGPSWLLPFSRRSNVCIPSSINKTITHIGALVPFKQNDTFASCRNGSSIRLSYNNQSDDEFYLSKEERWNIYIRLIHASYFLFILAVTFLCYSLIRGRMHTSVVKVDKIPLTL
ncbi:UNVERIFIED_CONTAM: hypothetical protein PYX00_008860 [Menopon gallinae]|uniref:TMEM248/TMEM219 domain-containing protein n=1 Tax=Menopon gallinae TaxID=328185 RepID=A0AAW2H937_9NEOP